MPSIRMPASEAIGRCRLARSVRQLVAATDSLQELTANDLANAEQIADSVTYIREVRFALASP